MFDGILLAFDRVEESFVKPERRGRHVLQIAEHPTGLEDVPAFPIESPLALMGEVVNGEARANDVLSSQIWKRQCEIVLDDTNPVIPTESFTEHQAV